MERTKQKSTSLQDNAEESTVSKGRRYEEKVAKYLRRMDYRIREHNFRCRFGEVDLIAEKGSALYFVEVKGQAKDQQSELKINADKKKRIEMTSVEYVRRYGLWEYGIHYDVAIVTGEEITYYQDAFEGSGDWI